MKYIRQQTILNKLNSETQHLTVRNWSGGSEFIQPGLVGFCTREKLQEFSVEAVQHVPKKLVSVLHRVRIFRERFNCISGGMRLNIGLYLLLITSKPWHNFPNSLEVKLDQFGHNEIGQVPEINCLGKWHFYPLLGSAPPTPGYITRRKIFVDSCKSLSY